MTTTTKRGLYLPSITLRPVTMRSGETKLQLKSPYTPSLADKAKTIGGKWSGGDAAWYFDTREVDTVRELCRTIWGIDPADSEPLPLTDVQITITSRWGGADLWCFGRMIAERRSRDARVSLGDGVSVVSGEFPRSGGSMKHPDLGIYGEPVVVLVRDIPYALAESAVRAMPPGSPDAARLSFKIVETTPEDDAEIAATLARLAHLDAMKKVEQRPASAPSPVDALWAQVQQLSVEEQVDLRNRLLEAL